LPSLRQSMQSAAEARDQMELSLLVGMLNDATTSKHCFLKT
jgi:hypothetical protein